MSSNRVRKPPESAGSGDEGAGSGVSGRRIRLLRHRIRLRRLGPPESDKVVEPDPSTKETDPAIGDAGYVSFVAGSGFLRIQAIQHYLVQHLLARQGQKSGSFGRKSRLLAERAVTLVPGIPGIPGIPWYSGIPGIPGVPEYSRILGIPVYSRYSRCSRVSKARRAV